MVTHAGWNFIPMGGHCIYSSMARAASVMCEFASPLSISNSESSSGAHCARTLGGEASAAATACLLRSGSGESIKSRIVSEQMPENSPLRVTCRTSANPGSTLLLLATRATTGWWWPLDRITFMLSTNAWPRKSNQPSRNVQFLYTRIKIPHCGKTRTHRCPNLHTRTHT